MPELERTTTDRIFWIFFFTLTALNAAVILLSPLTLAPDEAHYWEWSRRLDWAYYSKGPFVAWVIAASTALLGDTAFAVRLPALVLYSLFSLGFYLFVRRFFLPWQALMSWLALRSMLIFAQAGIVMTTDAPAAFFWFLGVLCAYLAVIEERRGAWILFGLFVGLGTYAKYTVAFLYPSMFLFLVFTPLLRSHLTSRSFLTGAFVFALLLLPLVKWNADHGWVNFQHNAEHVVRSGGVSLSWHYLPELLVGQFFLTGPLIFVGFIYAMVHGFTAWRRGDIPAGLFLWSSLPLGVLVCVLSLGKRIYANWPMPLYIGALLLLTHIVSQGTAPSRRMRRLVGWGVALSALITIFAHEPFLGYTCELPGKLLPTKRLVGWDRLGEAVSKELHASGGKSFVLADDYETASAIAFYSRPHAEVFCANVDDRRMNQYDIWGGLDGKKGQDALIVLRSPERADSLRPHFSSIEPVGSALSVDYSGTHIRDFYFFNAKNYDGSVPPAPLKR